MNEKQYLRANKRVFLAVTIIFAYITLTMLAALAASHGDHFVRIMIQCLVSVGVIILSALGYLTRKKTHTCAIILTTAMMVGYAAVALLNTTEGHGRSGEGTAGNMPARILRRPRVPVREALASSWQGMPVILERL